MHTSIRLNKIRQVNWMTIREVNVIYNCIRNPMDYFEINRFSKNIQAAVIKLSRKIIVWFYSFPSFNSINLYQNLIHRMLDVLKIIYPSWMNDLNARLICRKILLKKYPHNTATNTSKAPRATIPSTPKRIALTRHKRAHSQHTKRPNIPKVERAPRRNPRLPCESIRGKTTLRARAWLSLHGGWGRANQRRRDFSPRPTPDCEARSI